MGWFDNDPKDNPAGGAPRSAISPSPAAKVATPTRPSGSTIGERVHISGTIVAKEELTIHGKVDGDIHARQPLRIAKGAAVKALVEGTRVLLEGSMEGNLVATEAVVLGPTARLAGDIKAPSLEVQDGAVLKGSVEMPRPQAPKARGTADATAAKPALPRPAPVGNVAPKSPAPKSAAGKTITAKRPSTAGSASPRSTESTGSKAKEAGSSSGGAQPPVSSGSVKTARS